jgi:hypothetical protein
MKRRAIPIANCLFACSTPRKPQGLRKCTPVERWRWEHPSCQRAGQTCDEAFAQAGSGSAQESPGFSHGEGQVGTVYRRALAPDHRDEEHGRQMRAI